MSKSKKIFTATIAAAALAGFVASATPASAHHWHHGYGWGPYAAGAAGALALGMIAASAAHANSCYFESRPIYRHGYFVGYRQVQVC